MIAPELGLPSAERVLVPAWDAEVHDQRLSLAHLGARRVLRQVVVKGEPLVFDRRRFLGLVVCWSGRSARGLLVVVAARDR
jgi:hypothetical protein